MAQAKATWGDLDGIAVTMGPSLAGSLLVGVNVANAIALACGLPPTGVTLRVTSMLTGWAMLLLLSRWST